MPTLSVFFGIIVRMDSEVGAKHGKPHLHAAFSGREVVVALDGEVLAGSLPANKTKLLEAWMLIHQDDLAANWELLQRGEQCFRIDPLR
ncbi:MAG: DUF4160 domain-containing protein [Bifidobacteriaceae bacterium]|nr:DUF4160 domain-containing protein [Bifidobacteriaceae bacterium]